MDIELERIGNVYRLTTDGYSQHLSREDLGTLLHQVLEAYSETNPIRDISVSGLRDQIRPDPQPEQHDTERVPELDRGNWSVVPDRGTEVFFEGIPVYTEEEYMGL